jgi:hypothetical protein
VSPGDALHWTNPDTGQTQVGVFVCRYGARLVIETACINGHLGLRYVQPEHVRPVSISHPEHP